MWLYLIIFDGHYLWASFSILAREEDNWSHHREIETNGWLGGAGVSREKGRRLIEMCTFTVGRD